MAKSSSAASLQNQGRRERGVQSVKENAADDNRYERKAPKNGQPFFVLKSANGETIGRSEMYSSASAMENGIASVKRNAATATVDDLT